MNLRHRAIADERRLETVRTILDGGTILPKAVTYEDIDQAVFDWVDKALDLSYNGKRLPTFKLFSNQRISEYAQTWNNLDDEGNIAMNFKSVTRENNPQKGEMQGNLFNIPGNRKYTMFKVPVLEENGDEVYKVYSMKQPIVVNFSYVIVLVCDKYRLLNDMNTKVHDQFKSLECYLFPNGHPMPMLLDTIDDESEYTISDRKYYSQAYRIKLMGYIIRPEDFSVTKIPSRFKVGLVGLPNSGKKKLKKSLYSAEQEELDNTYINTDNTVNENSTISGGVYTGETCDNGVPVEIPKKRDLLPNVNIIDDDITPCQPDPESQYYYKKVNLEIDYPICNITEVEFEINFNMGLVEITTENIVDFKVFINGVEADFDELDDPVFKDGDTIKVIVSFDDVRGDTGKIVFVGYDVDVVIDKSYQPESPLDDVVTGEDLLVDREDGNKLIVTGQTTDPQE